MCILSITVQSRIMIRIVVDMQDMLGWKGPADEPCKGLGFAHFLPPAGHHPLYRPARLGGISPAIAEGQQASAGAERWRRVPGVDAMCRAAEAHSA